MSVDYDLLWSPDGRDLGDIDVILASAKALIVELRAVHVAADPMQQQLVETISDAVIFLSMVSEMMDERGASDFRIQAVRRRAGKPVDRMARARLGHRAAAIAEQKKAGGLHLKEAIFEATKATGLKRTEIFEWLRYRRMIRESQPSEIADLYLP